MLVVELSYANELLMHRLPLRANKVQRLHRESFLKGHSIVVIQVKKIQTEKTIEIQLVRPTEVCGKI